MFFHAALYNSSITNAKETFIYIIIIIIISTYLYRMTISVIVVTAINMGPVFTTQRTATTPGTSRPIVNIMVLPMAVSCVRP